MNEKRYLGIDEWFNLPELNESVMQQQNHEVSLEIVSFTGQ